MIAHSPNVWRCWVASNGTDVALMVPSRSSVLPTREDMMAGEQTITRVSLVRRVGEPGWEASEQHRTTESEAVRIVDALLISTHHTEAVA